jgi:hypothetical protein
MTDAEGLDALASREIVPAYIGFDATAPSLHVGSLTQIMMLRRLQQAGHKPIVLMGGGTSKIGDPSFKDEARKLLTDETINANIASIRTVFEHFLTFGDGPTDAVIVDNAEWLDKLEYIPFLREIGQHFSVNRMLSFDSVRLRMEREQSLSFLEFNYMILQGYDFLELSRRAACRLQLGGSDQWGNIVNGVELARASTDAGVRAHHPLITTADGGKMGKTERGGVAECRSARAYIYWQFCGTRRMATSQVPAAVHGPAGARDCAAAALRVPKSTMRRRRWPTRRRRCFMGRLRRRRRPIPLGGRSRRGAGEALPTLAVPGGSDPARRRAGWLWLEHVEKGGASIDRQGVRV